MFVCCFQQMIKNNLFLQKAAQKGNERKYGI